MFSKSHIVLQNWNLKRILSKSFVKEFITPSVEKRWKKIVQITDILQSNADLGLLSRQIK